MQTTMPISEMLGRYLDLTADQIKVTASNVANIDTPGYKTQGFDFEREFSSALSGSGVGVAAMSPQVKDVDGLVARPDGNTVSLDRESMQLAQAQLRFRMGVDFLRHEFNGMMSAIHVDGK